MQTEILSLFLLSCLHSSPISTISLPDRTSPGHEPHHYNPCVQSYTQKTEYSVIEERICITSNGNTTVQEYFDVARNYPCTWQLTKDDKTRCIPATLSENYFADIKWSFRIYPMPNQCLDPIVRLEMDPFHRPRSRYIGFQDYRGKFSVYEIGGSYDPRAHMNFIYTYHWDAGWERWDCISLLPVDSTYPITNKGFGWFRVGQEVDPTIFQER
jgi:hypothetical protein